MIGLLVRPAQRDVVREFFELCKTPWEFFDPCHRYEVVVSTGATPRVDGNTLVLIYSAAEEDFDRANSVRVHSRSAGATLDWWTGQLPIHGAVATFDGGAAPLLVERSSRATAFYHRAIGDRLVARIGYDVFEETASLLGVGQPAEHAACPTLDRHVALLRELVLGAGCSFVEIPPAPAGYPFIACLTHDVDHPLLANHRWDHTMLGFLQRATVGSMVDVVTGRRTAASLGRNLAAAARLPLVQLGLAADPWRTFDRYAALEHGLGSTYFVIPVRGEPGRLERGIAPRRRASAYTLEQIAPELKRIQAAGAELAVHGIDAWLDAEAGSRELAAFARATGTQPRGIRMHWLYSGPRTAAALEQAGYTYDASFGYNETIGYRAGTTQAYRPPGADALLELPLHVMDTALFYPTHLHLREDEAHRRIAPIIDHALSAGGVLTVNWHDRSIAPERQWEGFYVELLEKLLESEPWFPTAAAAVDWFRLRRHAGFEVITGHSGADRLHVHVPGGACLPPLRLRRHVPSEASSRSPFSIRPNYTTYDQPCEIAAEMEIHA